VSSKTSANRAVSFDSLSKDCVTADFCPYNERKTTPANIDK
jgi:hypothetical protein